MYVFVLFISSQGCNLLCLIDVVTLISFCLFHRTYLSLRLVRTCGWIMILSLLLFLFQHLCVKTIAGSYLIVVVVADLPTEPEYS